MITVVFSLLAISSSQPHFLRSPIANIQIKPFSATLLDLISQPAQSAAIKEYPHFDKGDLVVSRQNNRIKILIFVVIELYGRIVHISTLIMRSYMGRLPEDSTSEETISVENKPLEVFLPRRFKGVPVIGQPLFDPQAQIFTNNFLFCQLLNYTNSGPKPFPIPKAEKDKHIL